MSDKLKKNERIPAKFRTSEGDLRIGLIVSYKGKFYRVSNSRHTDVELSHENKFYRVVGEDEISVVEPF